jgi:hypothetical protein
MRKFFLAYFSVYDKMFKMRIKIIATVGESLRVNLQKKEEQEIINSLPLARNSPNRLNCEIIRLSDIREGKNININNLFNKYYQSFWQNISPQSAITFPCAELQSIIYLLDHLFKEVDELNVELCFIPTRETEEIADFLVKQLGDKQNQCHLENRYNGKRLQINQVYATNCVDISAENAEAFQSGLEKLYERLEGQLKASVQYDAIFIDITGGYKGFIPISALRGFLDDKVRVFYAHEKSKSVIIIPSLPLSFSLRSLDEMRSIVRREKIPKEEWENLPPRFKPLYYPTEWNDFKRTVFGEIVYKFYEEERTRRYGYGHYLLEMLEQNEREKLEERLPYWEHLWLGDQIPETVEHSRGHSQRLLEMAYHLFILFPHLKDELKSEWLYYLICAIWLHDIGHSALYYEQNNQKIPVYLMPSLVRDWHHLLSAQLIEKGDYLQDANDKQIVSLLAKYHRKAMKLIGDDFALPKDYGLLKDKKFPSLEKTNVNGKELLLTCALLRLLDACDVQADRVVSDEYRKQREKRTNYEMDFYYSQFVELKKKIASSLTGSDNRKLNELEKAMEKFKNAQPSEQNFKNLQSEAEQLAIEIFRDNLGKNWLLIELASLADKVIFKRRQEYDFLLHSGIDLVYLGKKEDKLAIYIVGGTDYNEENLKSVAKQIKEEFGEIEDILSCYGVSLSGIYFSETGERLDE